MARASVVASCARSTHVSAAHLPERVGDALKLLVRVPTSMRLTRAPLGLAPATDWTGSPPLKIVSVGTDITR